MSECWSASGLSGSPRRRPPQSHPLGITALWLINHRAGAKV